jgi:lysophospholipase
MPIIPNPTKFVALGLNTRPVFFGSTCTNSGPSTPLIVYLPNYFVSYPTNTQTLQVQYSKDQQLGFFQNGFDLATQSHESRNSSTVAPKWSTCLACALVDAQGKRNGAARSAECGKCFAKYCYTWGP